jgi:hypothetical protein
VLDNLTLHFQFQLSQILSDVLELGPHYSEFASTTFTMNQINPHTSKTETQAPLQYLLFSSPREPVFVAIDFEGLDKIMENFETTRTLKKAQIHNLEFQSSTRATSGDPLKS